MQEYVLCQVHLIKIYMFHAYNIMILCCYQCTVNCEGLDLNSSQEIFAYALCREEEKE